MLYFNPRTPGRVRHVEKIIVDNERVISIHAPRVGCDYPYLRRFGERISISIHAPRVGCDDSEFSYEVDIDISIHAPRVGCDTVTPTTPMQNIRHFNPRTPGRVRHTCSFPSFPTIKYFNPRTPGRVRQSYATQNPLSLYYFNPRTPGRVRPIPDYQRPRRQNFNPRTPGRVRLVDCQPVHRARAAFQSTHPG